MIEWATKRFPWVLVTEREIKRHQKAVEISMGQVVGYARWLLPPDSELANKDIRLEAQAAEPSPADLNLFERNMQEWPLPNVKSGEMIEFRASGLAEAEKRVKINGPFLSRCCFGIQKGILNFAEVEPYVHHFLVRQPLSPEA